MRVSFFEEFPTKKNLEKLRFIKFPTKVYLGCKSLKEFNAIVLPKNCEKVYWPVLKEEEGYWISPWSESSALKRVFSELQGKKVSVMLDVEFPKKRYLLLTNIHNTLRNFYLITRFLKTYKNKVYTTEYSIGDSFVVSSLFNFIGMRYSPKIFGNDVIKLLYTSWGAYMRYHFEKDVRTGIASFKDKILIGLGMTAPGVKEREPLIKPKELKRDLKICKKYGIKEVVIFRLGGLNKEFLKVIQSC